MEFSHQAPRFPKLTESIVITADTNALDGEFLSCHGGEEDFVLLDPYTEIVSRQQIMFENYSRIINIEALTLIDMIKKNVYPAINKYVNTLINGITAKNAIGIDTTNDVSLSKKLSNLNNKIYEATEKLEKLIVTAKKIKDAKTQAFCYHDEVLAIMKEIRSYADDAEKNKKQKQSMLH